SRSTEVAVEGDEDRLIADCGLRIADCGLRIADCGLRIADCGLIKLSISISSPRLDRPTNPQSSIPHPQSLHFLFFPTILRYGFNVFQPPGNFSLAASSERAGTMMQSSPCFQLTGVATLYLAVSWIESITRRISSKLRPVLAG